MSSDIYSNVDSTKKIRFTKKEPEDSTEWVEREVNIYQSAEDAADNYIASLPQEEDQQVHSPPADNECPGRSAKLCKTMLWILMLCTIVTLAIYLPLEIKRLKESNSLLQIKLLGKTCPDGWTRFGCSCYCKFTETKSWSDSRKHCQDRGADLVIIDGQDEQDFVKKLNKNGVSWIGLQNTRIETTWKYEWRWVDGSAVTQTFWATGWQQNLSYETYATCCNYDGKWTHRVSYSNGYNYNYNPSSWICEK